VPLSAVDAISPAFQHTKQQLIHPFNAGQWAKLALVGFLAGEMSSYGCSGPGNFQMPHNRSQQFMATPLGNFDPMVYVSLIVGVVIAGFVLGILFMYISSVMRFVLFDSVVNRRCEIRRSWRVRHAAGLRFFFWNIVLSLSIIAGMVILIGIPAAIAAALGWLTQPKEHLVPLILGGIALFFLFFVLFLTFLIVHVMTKDFVVPQMALENITALEGWRRLWPRMKAEKGSFTGYMGMKVVMALGAAVLLGIVTVIILLILLIPVGGIGAIAVLGGKAAGLVWDLYTISMAVVVGCILLAVVLYIVSFVSVPAIVFFPAYSIYFFADRYPPLYALLHPAPPPPALPDPFPV
jgi:hypothetical protein